MATAPKTPKTKTPAKPAAARKAKAAPNAPVAAPKAAQVLPTDLKKKELIEAVATATGQRRGEVKDTVEATLMALGRELAAGRSVQSPELGRLKVVKTKQTPSGPMAICRFRAPKPKAPDEI